MSMTPNSCDDLAFASHRDFGRGCRNQGVARRLVRARNLGLQAACGIALGLSMAACSPQSPPPAAAPSGVAPNTVTPPTQTRAPLDQIRESIRAPTGLASRDIEVSLNSGQFTVAIINGTFNDSDHSARNAKATDIVNAMASAISGMPEYADATGVHINFVTRPAGGGPDHIVDGIDFRKGASGLFTLHTT